MNRDKTGKQLIDYINARSEEGIAQLIMCFKLK